MSQVSPLSPDPQSAVDFPAYAPWLNTENPIELKQLQGHFVLLDFWTYGCINCMHTARELEALSHQFPELVILGIHSAKFEREQGSAQISSAIRQLGIHHPVLNDYQLELWKAYKIEAWPTFILIDPEGQVRWHHQGEGVSKKLPEVLKALSSGNERESAEPFINKRYVNTEGTHFLSYPTKFELGPSPDTFWLSDTGHERILYANMHGQVLTVIGSGEQGKRDGALEKAMFSMPQGLAYHASSHSLYVADTGNHLIRKVDLALGQVHTVLGSGDMARFGDFDGKGLDLALNAPWDIAADEEYLYIAMAGLHQIWRMELATGYARVWAGFGFEDLRDGLALQARLAQPSGLDLHEGVLYFADSESSAIRRLRDREVETIVGHGLFEFGDVDGRYTHARLQHPLAVRYHRGQLYAADTYNNKLKRIDPKRHTSQTVLGTGVSGLKEGSAADAQLQQPNDLLFLGEKCLIADTHNHAIRIWDMGKDQLETLQWQLSEEKPELDELKQWVLAPGEGRLRLSLPEHATLHMNLSAPQAVRLQPENAEVIEVAGELEIESDALSLPITLGLGKTRLELLVEAYLCSADESACVYREVSLAYMLSVEEGGEETWEIELGV